MSKCWNNLGFPLNYVETYVKSFADGTTAFAGAFRSGYCAI